MLFTPYEKSSSFFIWFFLSGQWKAHHSLSFFLNLQTSFVPGFLRQKTQVFSAIITEKALSRSNITQMLAADLRRRQRLLLTWALYSSYLILTFRMLGKFLGIQTQLISVEQCFFKSWPHFSSPPVLPFLHSRNW